MRKLLVLLVLVCVGCIPAGGKTLKGVWKMGGVGGMADGANPGLEPVIIEFRSDGSILERGWNCGNTWSGDIITNQNSALSPQDSNKDIVCMIVKSTTQVQWVDADNFDFEVASLMMGPVTMKLAFSRVK